MLRDKRRRVVGEFGDAVVRDAERNHVSVLVGALKDVIDIQG